LIHIPQPFLSNFIRFLGFFFSFTFNNQGEFASGLGEAVDSLTYGPPKNFFMKFGELAADRELPVAKDQSQIIECLLQPR